MGEAMVVVGVAMIAASAIPPVRYRRVGGLRFIRWGRLQASFCVVRGGV